MKEFIPPSESLTTDDFDQLMLQDAKLSDKFDDIKSAVEAFASRFPIPNH